MHVSELREQFVADHGNLALPRRQSIILEGSETESWIIGDRDRLIQVLLDTRLRGGTRVRVLFPCFRRTV
jgi:hypothetical protein